MSGPSKTPRALSIATAREGGAWGPGSKLGADAARARRLPTMAYIERCARRRLPRFAFDFLDGGTGDDYGAWRNRNALDRIEIVPRYGSVCSVDTSISLLGRTYAAPVGIAPTGNDGVVWPDATRHLARAAAKYDIPYVLGTLASASIEEVATICPDQVWFQLYGMPTDDHRVSRDLVRRADNAGVHVLVLALDAPVRSKRPRDLRQGLTVPFRPTTRLVTQLLGSPAWSLAAARTRVPVFANMARYVGPRASLSEVAGFVQRELRGTFTWEEIARFRDLWPRKLVVKGVLHPQDATRAAEIGVDGVVVSNHGGRQSDLAPASVDVLPSVVDAIGDSLTVMFDSGVRSGIDAVRALALGASAAFSGRGFLLGLAAVGDGGGEYVAQMLNEELRTAMAQLGSADVSSLEGLDVRHPSRFAVK